MHLQAHMAGKLTAAEQEQFGVDSYYNAGTTRTKANSTLFVAFRDVEPPVPPEQRAPMAESMFSAIPGYIGVRQVRAMCFVDFEDIRSATAGMMKFQGHKGLTIDYDKVHSQPPTSLLAHTLSIFFRARARFPLSVSLYVYVSLDFSRPLGVASAGLGRCN